MPRRKRKKRQSLLGQIDWSLEPETALEITAVALIAVGALLALATIGLAGSFGASILGIAKQIWGAVGYLLAPIFIAAGVVMLLPREKPLRPAATFGVLLFLIVLPALLSLFNSGGSLGAGVSTGLIGLVGKVATLLILLILLVISIMITFNASIKALLGRLLPERGGVTVNDGKVAVFTTRQPLGAQPVKVPVGQEINWKFPPLELLGYSDDKANPGNVAKNVETIQKALKDFGIEVTMGEVNIGPTVTQYTLKPVEGVKLNQIVARTNDLALSLAAHPIRLEAPIPGKAAVGVEVPNKKVATVTLREVLESNEYKALKEKSHLALALGRDVSGAPYSVDLGAMPHLLIAGATGSGKSVCLNGILMTLVFNNTPATLRIILVDPKRVEFTPYNHLPHLLSPVITDVDKTVSALKWAIGEMERRFQLFQQTGRRNIEAYNTNPPDGRLPYIVIVIDELADLMAQAANEVEAAIVRLAQMARATGIHLVVATQRPSVDVITGLIKANIPTRIAFAVASQVDSRTILDQAGAERLLGNGDMLYVASDVGKPKRLQGVLVSDPEIVQVTDFLQKVAPPRYDESLLNFRPAGKGMGAAGAAVDDDLYEEAKAVVVRAGKASASLLQRRLRIGYARAARLLDLMEENGAIGPADGAHPRDVLIDAMSLEQASSATFQRPEQPSQTTPSAPPPMPDAYKLPKESSNQISSNQVAKESNEQKDTSKEIQDTRTMQPNESPQQITPSPNHVNPKDEQITNDAPPKPPGPPQLDEPGPIEIDQSEPDDKNDTRFT